MTNKQQGFTLIELMVVIAIIGILTAVSFVSFSASMQTARKAALKDTMNGVQIAMYADLANSITPSSADSCTTNHQTCELINKAKSGSGLTITLSCQTSGDDCAALGEEDGFKVCVDMQGNVNDTDECGAGKPTVAAGVCEC